MKTALRILLTSEAWEQRTGKCRAGTNGASPHVPRLHAEWDMVTPGGGEGQVGDLVALGPCHQTPMQRARRPGGGAPHCLPRAQPAHPWASGSWTLEGEESAATARNHPRVSGSPKTVK